MIKEEYEKHLLKNVTKIYKRTPRSKFNKINIEAKNMVMKLSIEDRVERLSEGNAYIIIKDHKEKFPEKLSFRLIKPSKSEIGKISKIILDKVNKLFIESTKLNEWKSTDTVIEWFKSIENKGETSFIIFCIESFYPSILPELFNKSIDFAKSIHNISDNDLNMTMNARKTLLFYHEEPWMKKNGEEEFGVPMGCHDGAKICELVGTFVLNKISPIMQEQNKVGLYRDDGLGIFRNLSRPNIDRKKKEIIKIFKSFGLTIAVTTNVTSANYLDVNFDLKNSRHL